MSKTHALTRPAPSEYASFYANYVKQVTEDDIVATLARQRDQVIADWRKISSDDSLIRHAPYKWSLRQVLGHMNDAERVFGYRALRFSRGDTTELPGFDENKFVDAVNYDAVGWNDLIDEFQSLRQANCLLFQNMPEEAWSRSGIASGNLISVRALAYVLVGHVRHHAGIIQKRLGAA